MVRGRVFGFSFFSIFVFFSLSFFYGFFVFFRFFFLCFFFFFCFVFFSSSSRAQRLEKKDPKLTHYFPCPPSNNKKKKKLKTADVAAWMRGDRRADGSAAPPPFLAMGDASSVMWNRAYGKERYASPAERHGACRQLRTALDAAGCDRLVVGHTPQLGGANCECGGAVWRLDVGMSSGVLNARPAVLELPARKAGGGAGEEPRVLVVGGPACTLPPPIVNRDGKRGGGSAKDTEDGGSPRPGVRAGRRGLGNLVRGRTMAP